MDVMPWGTLRTPAPSEIRMGREMYADAMWRLEKWRENHKKEKKMKTLELDESKVKECMKECLEIKRYAEKLWPKLKESKEQKLVTPARIGAILHTVLWQSRTFNIRITVDGTVIGDVDQNSIIRIYNENKYTVRMFPGCDQTWQIYEYI